MDEVYSPRLNVKWRHRRGKMPNYVAPSVAEINYDHLETEGVSHLVFDVDNTLVSFGKRDLPASTREFLLGLKARPQVCCLRLASNSTRSLEHITSVLGVEAVQPQIFSFKPLARFYRRTICPQATSRQTIAMIGDKLVQDIWGANQVGFTTVLVQPLGRDFWLDRLLGARWQERRLLRRYLPEHVERWF